MRFNFLLFLASFLPWAAAQTGIATPTLGYAYDPGSRAIRPVLGIPGAAMLGAPLRTRFQPASAAVSPSQDYAFALSPGAGVRLVRWNAGRSSVIPVEDAIASPDRIAFSPSGAAAILYDSATGRMQALTGLPDSPALQEIQPAGSPAAGAFAIADNATIVLATSSGVLVIGPGSSSSPLPLPGSVAVIAFLRGSLDLLAVTHSGDLYVAKNINGNLDIHQIYTGDEQTASPVAVQFSPDGATAFAANTAGILSTIDLNTGSIAAVSCQCAPTGLEPFGRAGLFRITEISARPLLLFDGAGNRLWFVPAETQRSAQ